MCTAQKAKLTKLEQISGTGAGPGTWRLVASERNIVPGRVQQLGLVC